MIGLIISVVIFNIIAFKTNKRLTENQIFHIWTFTIAFQNMFDLFTDFRYHAYWYFSKEIDWSGLPAHIFLLPPVNMMFLSWYPFKRPLSKQILYFICWTISILVYESITLLPQPWGYFHYGWWGIWHSAIIDPILFLILLGYYKRVCKAEKSSWASECVAT